MLAIPIREDSLENLRTFGLSVHLKHRDTAVEPNTEGVVPLITLW